MAKAKAIVAPEVDRDWQAESDLRTLETAMGITADEKRFNRALKLAEQKKKDLTKLTSTRLRGLRRR